MIPNITLWHIRQVLDERELLEYDVLTSLAKNSKYISYPNYKRLMELDLLIEERVSKYFKE